MRAKHLIGWAGFAVLCGTMAFAADTIPGAKKKDTKSETKAPALSSKLIDEGIDKVLSEGKLRPQSKSSDGEFLRRVYLDVTGTIPEREEVLRFLADKDPSKREKLVDKLLASPEHVENMTDFWSEVLTSTMEGQKDEFRGDLRRWIKKQVKRNTPYDQFVSRLIRAQGYLDKNGAVAYMLRYRRDPLLLAASTSRLFMGAQIECAQCHDHPFADWKQDQFLKMSAWFSRMDFRRKLKSEDQIASELRGLKGKKRERYLMRARRDATIEGVFEKFRGDLVVNERGEPITGKNSKISKERRTISPAFIMKVKLDREEPKNRREAFALRLTSPNNKLFAIMAVNRMWAVYFGRGINNPVDDLSDVSVNTHPEMLETLAAAFVAAKYDLRALSRAILLSETYQRTSEPPKDDTVPSDEGEDVLMSLYGRMPVRPIKARPLARALARALVPPTDKNKGRFEQGLMKSLQSIIGKRSVSLDRYEETMQEALFLQNSPLLNNLQRGRRDNYVSYLLRTQPNDRERITRVFLNILTRPATARELERYETYVKAQENKQQAYEDIVWVLLNSSEFRYNH